MKTITIIGFLCFSFFATAQVGVGNTDPKSTLDISASSTTSPTNEDGILIPRIDNFPTINPTADQDGMMVFVTGNGTPSKGFYYWDNGSTAWVSILGTKNTLDEAYDEGGTGLGRIITADSGPVEIQGGDGLRIDSQNFNNLFYVRGDNDRIGFNTINPSSMIDIQSTGNGSVTNPVMELNTLSEDGIQINLTGDNSNIGGNLDGVYVVDNSSSSGVSTRTKAFSARMNGISTQTNHDVRVYEAQITNASNYIGNVYGFYSQNLSTNNGQQYGILNSISNSGNGTHYGAYNSLTGSGSGNKYGVYSNISSSAGGTHYGVYSYTPSITGYAGYFIGRTSLGNAPTNRYLMPAADGTSGQVMTTDGAGNVTFQDISSEDSDWYTQGSASSPTSINDNIFTQGNVAIGNTSSSGKTFYVETNPSINSTSISNVLTPVSSGLVKGIENSATLNGTTNAYLLSNSIGGNSNGSSIQAIRNSFSGSGSGTKTGMYNFFTFGFSGTARGVVNYFNNTGIDGATGITNTFDTTNPSSYNTGVYNQAFSTHSSSYLYGNRTFFSGASVSNEAYGTYNVVSTTGTDYGVYSRADNNSTDYAAFFSGRVSVGNDPALNRYFLPGNDGTAGQVMTTDGAGNVAFQDVNSTDSDWFEVGSTNAPNSINDDKYTYGNLAIGKNTTEPNSKLDIENSNKTNTLNLNNNTTSGSNAIGINNVISNTLNQTGIQNELLGNSYLKIGLRTTFEGTGLSTLNHYGVYNTFNTEGYAFQVGVRNIYTSANNSGFNDGIYNHFSSANYSGTLRGLRNEFSGNDTADKFGIYNNLGGNGTGVFYGSHTMVSNTGSGDKYGEYVEIASTSGGIHYGLYSDVQNSTGYAAYLIGRASLGNTTTNRYLMPANDGTNGQVMTTDGAGNITFQDPTTDNQQIDNFSFNSSTNILTLEIEDDGQAAQTVDLSSLNPTKSLARIVMSANQTYASAGWQKVSYDNIDFDTNSDFNTTTNALVVPSNGYYRINASWRSNASSTSTGVFGIGIYRNGAVVRANSYNHSGNGQVVRSINNLLQLNAGDTIEVYINTQASFTISFNDIATSFEIEQIQ